jgi:hypothetical protein
LAADDVPFQDFTHFQAGIALGNNVGLLWQPWDDNPTGVGVAVLNAGGTHFRRRPLVAGERAATFDQHLQAFADKYALAIENPDSLKPITNVGATLGYGGATMDLFSTALSVDYHDAGGSTLHQHLAGAAEIEGWLPPAVAAAAAVKYKTADGKHTFRFGFLGAHATAGVAEGDSTSYSAGLIFHGGTEQISPLRLTIDHYVLEGFGGGAGERRQGLALSLALTFVF